MNFHFGRGNFVRDPSRKRIKPSSNETDVLNILELDINLLEGFDTAYESEADVDGQNLSIEDESQFEPIDEPSLINLEPSEQVIPPNHLLSFTNYLRGAKLIQGDFDEVNFIITNK